MKGKVNIFGAANLWWWEVVFSGGRKGTPLILRSARGYAARHGAIRAFKAVSKEWSRLFRGVR